MGLVLTYRKCEKCGQIVELNGSGSTSNLFMTGVAELVNSLYPISQKLFRPASDWHDMAYHVGEYGKQKECDQTFFTMCLESIRAPEKVNIYVEHERTLGNNLHHLNGFDLWIVRHNSWWFKWQAEKFKKALVLGGAWAYPKSPCCERLALRPTLDLETMVFA